MKFREMVTSGSDDEKTVDQLRIEIEQLRQENAAVHQIWDQYWMAYGALVRLAKGEQIDPKAILTKIHELGASDVSSEET